MNNIKAIVLFDTLFGNTKIIAGRLVVGLQETGIDAECVNIKSVKMDKLTDYDLLVLGAPTQYLSASKPMKEFLDRVKIVSLRGKYGFAFDTRYGYPLAGSAAKFIEKKLKHLGIEIIHPHSSAMVVQHKTAVKAGDALLKEGTEEVFENIGKEIGTFLQDKTRKIGVSQHDTRSSASS